MAIDYKKLAAEVQSKGQNQSVSQAGGSYELPAAGLAFGRLVGYFELGKHAGSYQGKPKTNDKVRLVFELIGPKHPPREFEGVKEPLRISVNCNKSLSDKGMFRPLFDRMNYNKSGTHMIAFLGEAYKFQIVHVEKDGKTYANIKADTIGAPLIDVENAETGEVESRKKEVGPALTEQKAFVIDFADADMWDSIFIEGEYPERKNEKGEVVAPAASKNVIQLEIMRAVNFKGMPIYDYAMKKFTKEEEQSLEDAVGGTAEIPPKEAGTDDDLAGVV